MVESNLIKELKLKLLILEERRDEIDLFDSKRKFIVEKINEVGRALFHELVNSVENLEMLVFENEWHVSHTRETYASWCEYHINDRCLYVNKEYISYTSTIAIIRLDEPLEKTFENVLNRRMKHIESKIVDVKREMCRLNSKLEELRSEYDKINVINEDFEKNKEVSEDNDD